MATILTTRDVGDTIGFEVDVDENFRFSDNSSKSDVDSITITITDYDGNKEVDAQTMVREAEGQYYFDWDTTGLSTGDYEVVVEASKGTDKEKDDTFVRLQ